MKPNRSAKKREQWADRSDGAATALPPDWDRHPELAQALQVLVEGAVRLLREQ